MAATKNPNFEVGVCYGEDFNGQEFRPILKELGVRAYKVDLYWSWLQDGRGEYTLDRFEKLLNQIEPGDKAIVQLYTDHHIACVDRKLYPRGGPVQENMIWRFEELIGLLVSKASGRVHGWQLNTEPAIPRHWPADNPEGYVSLFNTFSRIVRRHAGKVILGAWAMGEPWGGEINQKFWGHVAGNADYDVAAVHLYGRIEDIPRKIEIAKMTGKPVWVTECGGPDPLTPDGTPVYSEVFHRLLAIRDAGAELALWWDLQEDMTKTGPGAKRFQGMALMDSSEDPWRKGNKFGILRDSAYDIHNGGNRVKRAIDWMCETGDRCYWPNPDETVLKTQDPEPPAGVRDQVEDGTEEESGGKVKSWLDGVLSATFDAMEASLDAVIDTHKEEKAENAKRIKGLEARAAWLELQLEDVRDAAKKASGLYRNEDPSVTVTLGEVAEAIEPIRQACCNHAHVEMFEDHPIMGSGWFCQDCGNQLDMSPGSEIEVSGPTPGQRCRIVPDPTDPDGKRGWVDRNPDENKWLKEMADAEAEVDGGVTAGAPQAAVGAEEAEEKEPSGLGEWIKKILGIAMNASDTQFDALLNRLKQFQGVWDSMAFTPDCPNCQKNLGYLSTLPDHLRAETAPGARRGGEEEVKRPGDLVEMVDDPHEKGEFDLSETEAGILRHTLGLNNGSELHRNYYCSNPSADGHDVLRGLVERGLMDNWDQGYTFHVTRKGWGALAMYDAPGVVRHEAVPAPLAEAGDGMDHSGDAGPYLQGGGCTAGCQCQGEGRANEDRR